MVSISTPNTPHSVCNAPNRCAMSNPLFCPSLPFLQGFSKKTTLLVQSSVSINSVSHLSPCPPQYQYNYEFFDVCIWPKCRAPFGRGGGMLLCGCYAGPYKKPYSWLQAPPEPEYAPKYASEPPAWHPNISTPQESDTQQHRVPCAVVC